MAEAFAVFGGKDVDGELLLGWGLSAMQMSGINQRPERAARGAGPCPARFLFR